MLYVVTPPHFINFIYYINHCRIGIKCSKEANNAPWWTVLSSLLGEAPLGMVFKEACS